jgi:hypothetical protein
MLNSKALKEYKYVDPDDLTFLQKIPYYLKKYFIEEPRWFIEHKYRKLKKAYEYAKLSWTSYDWDMSYAYQLFNFKLKRLYKALENGTAFQEPEDMKALKELIKIVHRLGNKQYDRKYHRLHDQKWGKIETRSVRIEEKDGKVKYYRWESWRESTKDASEEAKAQERQEFLACWKLGEKDRCRDIDRMAEILKVHGLKFWD